MLMVLADISGWVGAFTTLAAYTAFSMGWITNGHLFQAANLIGSAALIINGYHQEAWPFVLLNTVWGTISIAALVRLRRNRHSGDRPTPLTARVSKPAVVDVLTD
jgi:hypothetical protein